MDASETKVENEWKDGGEHRGSGEGRGREWREGRRRPRGFKGGSPDLYDQARYAKCHTI